MNTEASSDDETRKGRFTNPWNSLEVAKLIASTITPVVVLLVGIWINGAIQKQAEEQEIRNSELQRQWDLYKQQLNQHSVKEKALIENRVALWNKVAGNLNDIYAFNMYVGKWQEITPEQLLIHKRDTDKIVYSYRPFFSEDFVKAYLAYMKAAYKTYRGWNVDAGIRAKKDHRDSNSPGAQLIIDEDNRKEVHQTYYDLLGVVAKELDLKLIPPKLKLKSLN
jgi:hypothetical protein